jgi:hypothetical protein
MTYVIFPIVAILGGFARVWFGSDDLPKPFDNRGLQTIFMMLLFVICFFDKEYTWQGWLMVGVATCWMQFQYWSRGHGACIDMGRDAKPTPETIKRYNERWYHIPCDWLLPNHKYGFLYDFIYTCFRYGCPMIPMMIFDWRYLLVGLSIAPIYSFSDTLEQYDGWLFKANKWYWRRGWSLAEGLSGMVTYGSCCLLGLL